MSKRARIIKWYQRACGGRYTYGRALKSALRFPHGLYNAVRKLRRDITGRND